jgi:Uma2 family endonuclease
MAAAGILNEDSRVELIRGQIIDMAPIGAPHLNMVNRLTRLLPIIVGDRGIISVQNPVRLDDGSEPQPDVAVLQLRPEEYENSVPRATDVLLVIEVVESSLTDDRDVKAPLYAASGIPEYWIVNIVDLIVEVYRQPENGSYSETRRVSADDMLDVLMVPGNAVPATQLLRRAGEC